MLHFNIYIDCIMYAIFPCCCQLHPQLFPKGWASEKFRFFGDTWLYGVGDDLESWGVDGRGTQGIWCWWWRSWLDYEPEIIRIFYGGIVIPVDGDDCWGSVFSLRFGGTFNRCAWNHVAPMPMSRRFKETCATPLSPNKPKYFWIPGSNLSPAGITAVSSKLLEVKWIQMDQIGSGCTIQRIPTV